MRMITEATPVNIAYPGGLPRVTGLYPHVIRVGFPEKDRIIPRRLMADTQICFRMRGSSDTVSVRVNGTFYSAAMPCVLIKRPGELHECDDREGFVSGFYFVYAADSGVEALIPRDLVLRELEPTPRMKMLADSVKTLLRHLGEPGVGDRIDELCCSFLLELLLAVHLQGKGFFPAEERIGRAVSYLQLHYLEPLEWDDVARRFNFSRRSFTRHWKNSLNCTPSGYVARLRLTEARRLLEETDAGVGEIALRTGYISAETFANAFRRFFGVSPSKYRRRSNFSPDTPGEE